MGYFRSKNLADASFFEADKVELGSVQAAVSPWVSIPKKSRFDVLSDENWQQRVRKYDREGPGIVGAALDMPAATSMLLEPVVQQRSAAGWKTVQDNPDLAAVLGLWAGDCVDQRTLFSRLVRCLDGPGEGYLILGGEGASVFWQLAHTTNLKDNRDGTVTVMSKPGGTLSNGFAQIVPDQLVYHFHQADPEWGDVAWSPMRRGLDHIEKYRAIIRNIGRNVDSQLAMNGIVWSRAIAQKTNWIDHMTEWASKAISDDEGVESVMAYPMSTAEKPEWIDVGRGDHSQQIEAANMFLKAFAASTDLPTNMLLEGPGQANHWNAYLEGDFYADTTMGPRWQRACGIITETHLRPMIRSIDSLDLNPENYRVWANDHKLRAKTDNTETVFKAHAIGVASREAIREVAGLRPDQVLELPDGLGEYQAYLNNKKPDLYQPVTGSGDVVEDGSENRIAPGVTTSEPVRAEADPLPAYWNEMIPV